MGRYGKSAVACVSTFAFIASRCSLAQPNVSHPKSSDVQAIREFVRHRVDAGDRGDVEAWVDCFTEDVIIMPANATAVIGKEAIEGWERGFEGFRPQVELTIDEVGVHGDWAYLRSRISGAFIKDGQRFSIEGKELAILRRVQGQWKFHRICGNKNAGSRFERAAGGDGGR